LFLVCALCPLGRLVAEELPARAREAIRLQQVVKKRYAELTRIMGEVSRRLEASDPKTAAAISAAAQRAEAALIADDMDRVIALLQGGLAIPADATQAKVVMRLREVLNALRGEEGLEWRLFMLQELQQQMADLTALIERQQVLERSSRMLAFGDKMKDEVREARTKVDALAAGQEQVLSATRRLAASPAALEFTGIRHSLTGLLRRLDTAKGSLWNPMPAPDELSRNIVEVRRYHAEVSTLRTEVRAVLNRAEVAARQGAFGLGLGTQPATLNPQGASSSHEQLVAGVGAAADELDKSAKAMTANDMTEGLVALSEAKAHLQEALERLDQGLLEFPEVRPAVGIAAGQKKVDDAATQMEPALRAWFPAGTAQVDDTAGETPRADDSPDRLAKRPTSWAEQSPVLLALDALGAAARQEQVLLKLKDWSARLGDMLCEVDRIKEEPRYGAQKKDQEGIVTDLRAILDINRRRAETVENDAELVGFFSLLRTALEDASVAARKAADELGLEHPKEANVFQNEVIHLLTTVRNRVGPELKMDKNKYAMNEQMLARIQRMIIKQKIFIAQAKVIDGKRAPGGAFRRTEQLLLDGVARDQAGLEEDFKYGWEIMNTAHNVGYALFPPEARVLYELARRDSQNAAGRLAASDPGPDTQAIQETVLERLKSIAILLGPGFYKAPEELDRRFTYDSFLSRMSLHNTRPNEIGLLVTLQEDINRRTAVVDKLRRTGKADASVEDEFAQLHQLQEHVRAGLERFAFSDARSWMGADWMPTAYGSNPGGAVQGRVAPSMKK
jgi:hypothetical protein